MDRPDRHLVAGGDWFPARGLQLAKYDAIVIGSGQGGNPLTNNLADQGCLVALIEKAHLGGTCINTGCTPPKTMIASTKVAHYARQAMNWGVEVGDVSVDLEAIVARKNNVVESFRAGQQHCVEARKTLRSYRGEARFASPRQVRGGDKTLEGERIFINTGARPAIPAVPGLDSVSYLTNASIMKLKR
jgi:pyruvate/2-oxoglutarate dehydrogenase complex dihydrolipoamide dehydrogenase (E3) component